MSGRVNGVEFLSNPYVNEVVALVAKSTDLNYIADHNARHEWLGADVMAIKKLALALPPFEMMDWSNFCIGTVTGSGYDWSSNKDVWIATGATNGSTAGRVSNSDSLWHDYSTVIWRWMFGTRLSTRDANDLIDAWVGFFADAVTYPTDISNHYGFRLLSVGDGVDADLWATNGDGATETATQIIAGIPAWGFYYLVAVYGPSDIKYYYSADGISWTLGATHTTNRPTACSLYLGQWIKNGEALDKAIQCSGWKYANGD